MTRLRMYACPCVLRLLWLCMPSRSRLLGMFVCACACVFLEETLWVSTSVARARQQTVCVCYVLAVKANMEIELRRQYRLYILDAASCKRAFT